MSGSSDDDEVQVDDYDDLRSSRGSSQDALGNDNSLDTDSNRCSDREGDDNEDDGDDGSNVSGPTSVPVASSIGEAILSDVKTAQHVSEQPSSREVKGKATDCCVCGSRALYTCPGCGRRTCSITCVRVHKTDFHCTGERDVAAKIPLSEFTDQQLERDYRFLEDCRRVVNNVDRSFPRSMWRFSYKALPPPLHALREAARRRGVICQITSEGMRKRDENTSRLDRKTNTIVWRCEFQFVEDAETPERRVVIATNWGSERHHLADILKYCWATNPALLCYHINRQYNRASRYVSGSDAKKASDDAAATSAEPATDPTAVAVDPEGADGAEAANTEAKCEGPAQPSAENTTGSDVAAALAQPPAPDPLVPLYATEEVPPMPPIEPVSPEEAQMQAFVNKFLREGPYVILSKAERLGVETKYFRLLPHETLNENLRLLFFVNEFPVFVVVHASQLDHFPLVTEADKEAIRATFRSKRTQEARERERGRERAPLRKRSDMEPEELERLAKVPCRRFLHARCPLAEECPYWHCTPEEIPVCRSFLRSGQCDKGPRCSFRHDQEAVRVARKRQRDGDGGGGWEGRGRGRGRGMGGRGGRGGGGGGFRGARRRMG